MTGAARPRLLLTRPRAQAERMAPPLAAEGWVVLIWPLFAIVPIGPPPDLRGVQAALFTSANAVRRVVAPPPIPALCVGEATAEAARAAGFAEVVSADGDAAALAVLAAARLDPAAGPAAFVRGRDVAGELTGALRAQGFDVRENVVYAAERGGDPPPDAAQALAAGDVAAAAFHSPRAAAAFAAWAAGARPPLGATVAVAISPACAAPLAGCGFAAVRAAPTPDATGMRELLSRLRSALSDAPNGHWRAASAAARVPTHWKGERAMTSGDKRPDGEVEVETAAAAAPQDAPAPDGDAPAQDAAEGSAPTAPDDAAEPSPTPEPVPMKDPAPAPAKRGFAGTALRGLVVLLLGAVGALYLAPQLKPYLPAPLAALVTSGGPDEATADRMAALETALAAVAADAEGAAQSADTALAAAAATSERLVDIAAAAPDTAGVDALTTRVAAIEDALAGLRAAISDGAAAGGADPAALAALRAELAAAVEGQAEAVSALRAEVAAVETQAAGGGEIAALRAEIADLAKAREAEAESRAALVAAADTARRAAALSGALAEIDRAMTFGQPFAEAMATVRASADAPPPEALVQAAETGAPTREALKASFPAAAYAAIAAALEAEAESGESSSFARLAARLQARVTGLPSEAVPGDSAPAKLSRARAALLAGDIDVAVATISALPAPAQAAMADWTAGARLRADADVALREWRAALTQVD